MRTVDSIIKSATVFYKTLSEDSNGRFRSWEYCYKCFHDARNNPDADVDYLCLHLAFYLASWGMYRGSSFLLQKDYKVHKKVVKEILKPQYDCLFGIKCSKFRDVFPSSAVKEELLELCSRAILGWFRQMPKSPRIRDGLSMAGCRSSRLPVVFSENELLQILQQFK
jgi:hypothetical protein